VTSDRLKEPIASVVDFRIPGVDYLAEYSGRVVQQRGSNSFDFQPDDARFPSMAGIPICVPFPGFSLQVDPTQSPRARLGWNGGDPSKPELRLWEAPGLAQLTMGASQSATLQAPAVNLGSAATQPLVLGTVFTVALTTLLGVLSAAFTAIAAGFTAGVAAWAAAATVLPVLAPAAAIASAGYGAAATASTAAVTAISTFLGNLSNSLSTVSKTA
jgi:hypothetical protein